MNARRESKEKIITWRIQEDSNCWTLLEYFLEPISCILYVVSKLGKSAIQCFKRCMIRSWNGVMTIGSRSYKAEGQFRGLRNHKRLAAKWCPSSCEISQPTCTPTKFSWSFPIFVTDIFRFFCFRYLISKSPNSPCNPTIIGFLSL